MMHGEHPQFEPLPPLVRKAVRRNRFVDGDLAEQRRPVIDGEDSVC